MLVNEIDMRITLLDLGTKLENAEPKIRGSLTIHHKIPYLELQEHCETLLEDVGREFGSAEKNMMEVNNLKNRVNIWLARLKNDNA